MQSFSYKFLVELLQGTVRMPYSDSKFVNQNCRVSEAVAIDCEMVGGGSDGSLDLCARVCLIDEDENVILHTYVHPQIPITNYRCLCALCCLSFRRIVSNLPANLIHLYHAMNVCQI